MPILELNKLLPAETTLNLGPAATAPATSNELPASTTLNLCQELPGSTDFDLAGAPGGGPPPNEPVTGTLAASSTLTGTMAGQSGVQGGLAATTPMPSAACTGAYDPKVFRGLIKTTQSVNQAALSMGHLFSSFWQNSDFWRELKTTDWQDGQQLSTEVNACIGNLDILNIAPASVWAPASALTSAYTAGFVLSWPLTWQRCAPYMPAAPLALTRAMPYVLCWPLSANTCAPYEPGQKQSLVHYDDWQDGTLRPVNTCTNWQPMQEPPFIWPIPLPPLPPEPPGPEPYHGDPNLNLICLLPEPIWGEVMFNLGLADICQQALPVGWLPPGFIPRRVIIVTHDLWIKLLSDNSLLPCTDIGLSIDRDAWGWSWTAKLPERRPELLTAQHDVEINIDGHIWRGIIETMSGSRQHVKNGGTGYSIGGRSLAAELSTPFTAPRGRHETAARTAIQLAETELENTGWTLDWQAVDWLVAGGCFSYSNATPMGALKMIADSIDAIIVAHRTDKTLTVLPRYPVSPWSLAAASPDVIIPLDMVKSESISFRPKTLMRGVWVSGQSQGVRCRVYRSGSDGAPYHQMVVAPLITEVAAARERGRSILAGTGQRRDVTLPMPLLPAIGVLTPGQIVELADTPTWRGYLDGVNIAATRTKVTQTATIEQVLET